MKIMRAIVQLHSMALYILQYFSQHTNFVVRLIEEGFLFALAKESPQR
jgi:hypothetical protein